MAITAKSKSPATGEARRVPHFRATDSNEPYCPARSVRGSGHFAFTNVFQARRASAGTGDTYLFFTIFFALDIAVGQLERVALWPPLFAALRLCRFPYAAILVAAILSALLAPICVSSFSAFISSCKLSLSKAAAFGRLS
jgi:hypothetical protein